jgi:hypothetical protein
LRVCELLEKEKSISVSFLLMSFILRVLLLLIIPCKLVQKITRFSIQGMSLVTFSSLGISVSNHSNLKGRELDRRANLLFDILDLGKALSSKEKVIQCTVWMKWEFKFHFDYLRLCNHILLFFIDLLCGISCTFLLLAFSDQILLNLGYFFDWSTK